MIGLDTVRFGPKKSGVRSVVASRWVLLVGFVGLPVLPIVAHGCHGDDLDHEPIVAIRDETRPSDSPPGK